jgi:hypothetical protein
LAEIQEKLGYFGAAKQSLNDLLALLQSQDGQERTDFASWFPGTYAKLADVSIANKEFEEARGGAAQALAQLLQKHPEQDGDVDLYVLKRLQLQGRIAAGEQRFDKASACFAEGIAVAARAVAAGQVEAGPWADALQYYLAKALLDGRRNEAEAAIKEAVARNATRLEEDAADAVAASFLARSLILKARVLLAKGTMEETLVIAGQARELLSPLAEKEWYRREDLAGCLRLLAEAHDAKSESEIAARLREQAADTLLRAKE